MSKTSEHRYPSAETFHLRADYPCLQVLFIDSPIDSTIDAILDSPIDPILDAHLDSTIDSIHDATIDPTIDSALYPFTSPSCFSLNSSLQGAGWWVVPSMRQTVREALA